MQVTYVDSPAAVGAVVRRGFARALSGGRLSCTAAGITLRAVTDGYAFLEAEAVLLLDIPEAELKPFSQHLDGGARPVYVVSAEFVDRHPVLAHRGTTTPAQRDPRARRLAPALAGLAALLVLTALVGVLLATAGGGEGSDPRAARAEPADRAPDPRRAAPATRALASPVVAPQPARPRSRALGTPTDGQLVNGVALPAEGEDHFTVDATTGASPNPRGRRFGTDRTVERVLAIATAFRRDHPRAPRVGISDLSLPRGGPFGLEYGGSGHLSHQNGLDVDLLYPRLDRREAEPETVDQIDARLAQNLVDRVVAAGAEQIYVGSNTELTGPAAIVSSRAKHDGHMHVRFGD